MLQENHTNTYKREIKVLYRIELGSKLRTITSCLWYVVNCFASADFDFFVGTRRGSRKKTGKNNTKEQTEQTKGKRRKEEPSCGGRPRRHEPLS